MEIVKLLKEEKQRLLKLWADKQAAEAARTGDHFDSSDTEEYSKGIVDSLIQSMEAKNIDQLSTSDLTEVSALLREVTLLRVRQGYSPRETGTYIFSLKESLFEVLDQKSFAKGDFLDFIVAISRLLDGLAMNTFETFIEGREDIILRQTDEITEISTPVIKVWDGILALPIIGTLDSARTQVVLENLLQEIVETGSSIAILDISGVPTVDSLVAQHLLKAVSATRLMGADCVISGIRPEIAQTIVHLGIDLSQIVTKATLASALQHAFKTLGLQVHKTSATNSVK